GAARVGAAPRRPRHRPHGADRLRARLRFDLGRLRSHRPLRPPGPRADRRRSGLSRRVVAPALRDLARSAAARAPLLEVLARSVYFRTLAARRSRDGRAPRRPPGPRIAAEQALEALDALAAAAGLPLGGRGRILLVHSSFDAV